MTNKKTEKVVYEKIMYETHDGEIFDVDGAFKRHPAITPGKANIDLTAHIERHTGLYFELRLSDKAMARLVQILNAAPVNGDPLQAIVNLDLDTTANEAETEKIAAFLSGNGYDATLENVAAGYLYAVSSDKPLLLDVVTDARREYAITCVASRYDNEAERYSGNGKRLSTITFNVPTEPTIAKYVPVTVVSEQHSIHIEDMEGSIIGDGMWRIMHALEPGDGAALGGFILERIKEGAN